ncbi:hypothetical protein ACSBR1_042418 [Camellia fascicularis]
MCKDSKPKESGGKGKGKQAAGGSDDTASKGKGKGAKTDGLGTCTYVKGCFFPLICFSGASMFF